MQNDGQYYNLQEYIDTDDQPEHEINMYLLGETIGKVHKGMNHIQLDAYQEDRFKIEIIQFKRFDSSILKSNYARIQYQTT